jgi:hypothetical protein
MPEELRQKTRGDEVVPLPELLTAILHRPFPLTGETIEIRRLDEVRQKCLAQGRQERYATVAAAGRVDSGHATVSASGGHSA